MACRCVRLAQESNIDESKESIQPAPGSSLPVGWSSFAGALPCVKAPQMRNGSCNILFLSTDLCASVRFPLQGILGLLTSVEFCVISADRVSGELHELT